MAENAPGQTMSREKVYTKLERINTNADNSATATIATASMPNTTKSVEVFDSDGASLGFVALYANATLT